MMKTKEPIENLRGWVCVTRANGLGPLGTNLVELDEIADEIEAQYMRLPVDADGVPIRPGDTIRRTTSAVDNIVTVIGVSEREFFFNGPNFVEPGIKKNIGNSVRHVIPDTVEGLLQELADEVWEASCTCQTTWSDSGLDGIAERYAERIRKVVDR